MILFTSPEYTYVGAIIKSIVATTTKSPSCMAESALFSIVQRTSNSSGWGTFGSSLHRSSLTYKPFHEANNSIGPTAICLLVLSQPCFVEGLLQQFGA